MKTTRIANATFIVDDKLNLHIHQDGHDPIKLDAWELAKISKNYQGANRIHKPMGLLFWSDVKNNKYSNWTLI